MADDDLKKVRQDQNDFQRSLNSVDNLFQSLNQGQQQNNNGGSESTPQTGGGTSNQRGNNWRQNGRQQ